MEEQKRNIWKW